MDVGSTLSLTADRCPDRRAVGGPRPRSYREWDARTNQLARMLAGLSIRAGDRVGLLLGGGEPMAGLHLAIQKLGAVTVPLSTRLGRDELSYCLDDAEIALLVSDPTTAPTVPDGFVALDAAELVNRASAESDGPIEAAPADSDLSVILYTSGTTGRPKGVPRTHGAEHAAAVAHVIQARYAPGERTLGVMPLFHTMGLRNLIATILVGGTWVPQARFDAATAVDLIEAESISSLYLVPTMYWSLLQAQPGDRLRSVRRLAYAGAPMTPALTQDLTEVIAPEVFVNHVGSTEVFTFTVFPDVRTKPGCSGRAGVFSRVRLIEPEPGAGPQDLVKAGEPGRLIVSLRSPEAFAGYWRRPDADAAALHEGWYSTGDLATADSDGDLWLCGRADDMINSGGENVYPDQIEAALIGCPQIAELAVVGLADARWGQAVTAFVVAADGVSPRAAVTGLRRYAREVAGLPGVKLPKRIVAIEAIPKSPVGKILRRNLTAGEWSGLAESDTEADPEVLGPARVEDTALVCGQGRFLDDLDPLPGTLCAAIVRSPHAHARITSFDATRALAHPGVAAVLGPQQIADELRPFPLTVKVPMPCFPVGTDKVRFVGEPVAVVVATDRYLAEDAAELVEVTYEVLPAVVDTRAALLPDAPRLHEQADSNVATDRRFSFGEVDARFTEAARVVSGEYTFPRYSSVPMECYSVIAQWRTEADGPSVDAWANFHGPFTMVPVMAAALGIPTSRLRLQVPADIGGGFGIKAGIFPYVVLLALASKHAGRPVRWTEDRLEHLVASSTGAGRAMRFEAAVTAEGKVTALRADLVDNVGAYLRPPEPSTLYRCHGNFTGAYRIDAVEIRARAVVTNAMPTGLNRGFGGPQLYFGLERLMDTIAVACDLDPVEVRRRNLITAEQFPYTTPTGGVYDSGDYAAAVGLLVRNAKYEDLRTRQEQARAHGDYYGIGVATVVDPSGTNIGYVGLATPAHERTGGRGKSGSTEHVRISVDLQGIVTVLLGSVPQGQGHATTARKVVAARLGLPPERVRPVVEMDTASTPWTVTSGSYSSRFAPLVTSALVDAADRIAATILQAGAVLLDCEPDDLELAQGKVRRRDDPSIAVEFRHAAGLVHWDPGALPEHVPARLNEEGTFSPWQSKAPSAEDRINSSLCYGFVAELVAVRIDPATLQITLEQVVAVHDVGTVLDATLLEGQVHGALAHGLGGALYEEFRFTEGGQPTSATFLDYLCPTSAESLFPLDSDRLVTPSPLTRLGAKGCGEGSSMSFPVAIANAVADALAPLGVEINSLPLHGSVLHDLLENATTKEN